jgi:hypothetical protein
MTDPALEAAYRDTDYRVLDAAAGPFTIRIGEFSFELEVLMFEDCVFDWAFVTACNPGSRRLPADENARRMAELEKAVRAKGFYVHHGEGVGQAGKWPPEPSLLILGLSEARAVDLARHFGQNAIVAGRAGEPARLVWTGSPDS